MIRRQFLLRAGKAAALFPLWSLAGCREKSEAFAPRTGRELERLFLRENDRAVKGLLQRQERRSGHPRRGGIRNVNGLFIPMNTAIFVQYLTTAYCLPDSIYFQKARAAHSLEEASECLLRMQHADGTIDLNTTNFHSTPDTGFVVEPLAMAVQLMRTRAGSELAKTEENLLAFLSRAGQALATGGIHTPNHRWVVCMALAHLYKLFPKTLYLHRIEEWLSEGLDVDEDGQYYEKSTAIYSPLTNRCLITIARLLDKPALLEPVRKNLTMTQYYLHSNGELVTEASGRQDQYRIAYPDDYYYPYYFMAIRDQNPAFTAMVRRIEQTVSPGRLKRYLIHFLTEPKLSAPLPPPSSLPENYVRTFPGSGLLRIRRGHTDATFIAQNPTFFTFFKGEAALQAVRLASAFFGKGQFRGEQIGLAEGGYRLTQRLEGPYYQPFPPESEEVVGDEPWEKERQKRPRSEVQKLESSVTLKEQEGQCFLEFELRGTDRVPLAIELAFRHGGSLTGVRPLSDIPDAFLLEGITGSYSFDGHTIEFGPGRAAHQWTQLRGAEPKLDALSVYITGYTPFRFKLHIR